MAWTPANAQEAVEALYIGYFGRAGEPGGVQYWINQINAAPNIATGFALAAAAFSVQQEAKNEYAFLAAPDLASPVDFITSLYNNLLERAPDAAGLAYWTGQAQAAAGNPFAIGLLVAQFISGATNSAAGNDIDTIQNKVDAAEFFTQALADANISGTDANGQVLPTIKEAGANIIGQVTEDDATVTAANEASTEFAAGGGTGAGVAITIAAGNSVASNAANPAFRSTESADTVTGILANGSVNTAGGNDVINVTVGGAGGSINAGSGNDVVTLATTAFDFTLDGGAGANSLTWNVNGILTSATAISNIQTVTIDTAGGGSTVDFTNVVGVTSLTITGANGLDIDNFSGTAATLKDVSGSVDFNLAADQAALTLTLDNATGDIDVLSGELETFTINVATDSATTGDFDVDAATTILLGSADFQGEFSNGYASDPVTFDASGFTGESSITLNGFAADATVKLSNTSGFLTIELDSGFDTAVTLGAGADDITVNSLSNVTLDGADVDSLATFTGFGSGDTIDVSGIGTNVSFTGNGAIVGFTLEAAIAYVNTNANAGAGLAAGEFAVFQLGGSTYIYADDATDGLSAGDGLMQIVGVTGLSATQLVVA